MDIHKPKPIHGWREFVGEIGVIVIGVLIALAGEQAVETLHWRHQIETAHEALASDFAGLVAEATERETMSACLGGRLDMLAAILDEAERTGRLPPLGGFGAPANRPWQLSSWNGLVAAQVATHLPRAELLGISGLSAAITNTAEFNDDELAQWSVLYTMVGPGRPVAAEEIATLRRALVKARLDAKYLRLEASQIDGEVTHIGLLPPQRAAQARQDAVAASKIQDSMCPPVGAAPDHYGLAAPSRVQLTGPVQQFRLRRRGDGEAP